MAKTSAVFRMGFALLRCCWGCWHSPSIHQSLMRSQSSQKVRLCLKIFSVPYSFCKGTASNPNFSMMNIFVAQLTPQTHLSSYYICLKWISSNHLSKILTIQIQPRWKSTITHTHVIANSHIQIIWTVLRYYYFWVTMGIWQITAPPMHDIISIHTLLSIKLCVYPIHKCFFIWNLFKNGFLFGTIMFL